MSASDWAALATNSHLLRIKQRGKMVVLSPGETLLVPVMTAHAILANESCVTEEGIFWDDHTTNEIFEGFPQSGRFEPGL